LLDAEKYNVSEKVNYLIEEQRMRLTERSKVLEEIR
jgi:hypothetical protein